MKLLAVGDSFTWGSELSDNTQAWPYLLGDRIGYAVENLAVPGSGNSRATRLVVENIDSADLIVVAWSHYARLEFADDSGVYDTWPGHRGITFTGELAHRKKLLDYINRHHNLRYLYKQYLINILLLQNFLAQHNKQYVMLDTFGNLDKRNQFYNLTSQVDGRYYLGWPTETMMEWTYECPQGPGGHFLEQGHKQVADKVYEHIRNLSWVS